MRFLFIGVPVCWFVVAVDDHAGAVVVANVVVVVEVVAVAAVVFDVVDACCSIYIKICLYIPALWVQGLKQMLTRQLRCDEQWNSNCGAAGLS